jgi:hypothetical protein
LAGKELAQFLAAKEQLKKERDLRKLHNSVLTIQVDEILSPFRILGPVRLQVDADGEFQPVYKIIVQEEGKDLILNYDEARARAKYARSLQTKEQIAPKKKRSAKAEPSNQKKENKVLSNEDKLSSRLGTISMECDNFVGSSTLLCFTNKEWIQLKSRRDLRYANIEVDVSRPLDAVQIGTAIQEQIPEGFIPLVKDLTKIKVRKPKSGGSKLSIPLFRKEVITMCDDFFRSFLEQLAQERKEKKKETDRRDQPQNEEPGCNGTGSTSGGTVVVSKCETIKVEPEAKPDIAKGASAPQQWKRGQLQGSRQGAEKKDL